MSSEEGIEPTDDDLELVARHGSGPFIRTAAAVRLARRWGRLDELEALLVDEGGPSG